MSAKTAVTHRSALHAGVRRAEPGDAERLWTWANDPDVRASAFSHHPIPREAHTAWFDGKLASPDCDIWILLGDHGAPEGQVRYDRAGDTAHVDISIARECRGWGLGRLLLLLTLPLLPDRWGLKRVEAHIKTCNLASQKSFEGAGFVHAGPCRTHPGCVVFVKEVAQC